MDGENSGKPYQNGWFGGFSPYFWFNTHMYPQLLEQLQAWDPYLLSHWNLEQQKNWSDYIVTNTKTMSDSELITVTLPTFLLKNNSPKPYKFSKSKLHTPILIFIQTQDIISNVQANLAHLNRLSTFCQTSDRTSQLRSKPQGIPQALVPQHRHLQDFLCAKSG